MTKNQDTDAKFQANAEKIFNATASAVKKAGDKAWEGTKEFLNHPIDTTKKIAEGLKDASKSAVNFAVETGTNLLTDPKAAMHTTMGLAERAFNAIPGVGGILSFFTGTAKDALTDQKFQNIAKEISGLKEGLNSLRDAVGEAIDGLRGEMAEALAEMGARQDELEQFTKAFKAEQDKINQKVQQQIKQIEETLKEHEKKIKDNSEKIFKESIKIQDVRAELKDQIRMTNTNVENLRKEQEETKHDFEKYKHQINEKSAKTEQAFDDLQADYTRRNKIIETQIHDNEEQLSEFQENLANVEFQQKKMNLDYQQLAEDLEEQVSLAREQKTRLDMVVDEIDEIHEEFNAKINRITQSQLEQEEKVDEAVFAAKRATRKVDELSEKLEKHNKRVDKLQDQIEKNKQETQKAKEETKRANERIDNLLKNQQLLDYSKEQQNFAKLTKSLELKAEEAQLLASLELLKKTQKLITTPAEREWRVGIKEGTEKDTPRPEGYPLKPDSSWAKKYTKDQLEEWGWDTRLLSDNEMAPLTDEDKRKPEEAAPSQPQQQSEQQQEQQKNLQEVIEETKSQLLEQLQEIQEQINENVSSIEENTMAPQEDSESEDEEIEEVREELEKKEIKLRQERAQAKAQLTKSRNKQTTLQQQKETKKAEIVKEQKNIRKLEQSIGNPSTTPQQKKKQQENKFASEEKLTQLQKQLEQIEAEEKKQEKATEQAEEAVQKKEKELEKVQSQKPTSIESKKIDKEIKDAEQKANQAQHEYVEQQWQEVKKQEEQILEDSPEVPELKKIEEKIQEIKESQSSTASPQRSMELYMLWLIIFLLEYIVYKRNGLAGLVVLNIILLICYWYKEQIWEHYAKNYKQFGHYLLILGYIMGNVLAYSAPEKEKYKWPCVIGFNAILAALYGYTWYKNRKAIETKQEELVQSQEEFADEIVKNEVEYVDRLQEAQEALEKTKEKIKNSSVVNFSVLSQGIDTSSNLFFTNQEDIEKAKKIYEEIKQKYAKKENDEHLISPEAQKYLKLVRENPVNLSEEEQELVQKIQQKKRELEFQEFSQLTNKIIAAPEELKKTLGKLLNSLSEEQIIAIASQSPYLKDNQDKLTNIYSHLNKEEKLKLLNSGLDSLQINTAELKKELLNIRLTTRQEERNFDLSVGEKENILRLITSQVSENQLKTYEEYGVPLYNASSWQITPEHKKSLLGLAEELVSVEDKEGLFSIGRENLEKFPLSGKQEQILRILAPLQREYSYSENLLKSLQSLPGRQFLTQREIIPLEHRKTADPYKELKKRVLGKKYKEISWEIKEREKEEVNQKTQVIRNSLLLSLLFFAQTNKEDLAYQEYRLSKETFNEKEDWVSIGAIDSQQRDLLFLSGFKSMPKYYFFDLLVFVVENFTMLEVKEETNEEEIRLAKVEEIKTQILIILDAWRDKSTGRKKEAVEKAIKQLSNDKILEEQQFNRMNLLLNSYPNDDNERLNFLIGLWKEVRTEKNQANFDKLLTEYSLKEEWEKYLELVKERTDRELQRKAERLNSHTSSGKGGSISVAPNITYLEEKFERLTGAYERMREYIESEGMPERTATSELTPQTTSSSSPYDNLLTGLDKEEQERLKKKRAREEARKRLDEAEFNRRQGNLSEKDRKLKEEEEKRQRDKELEEQEAEKARQAQAARDRAISEDRDQYLKNEAERLEKAQKRAEEELAFKEKQAEEEKKKKEQEIEGMRKKTEQEEREIAQREELMKKELDEKLKEIATEDKEGQRKIKEKYDTMIAENQRELNELRRKNDDELVEKKAQAKKEADQAEESLRSLRKQKAELDAEADRAKTAADNLDRELEASRDKEMSLNSYRSQLYDKVMGYYFIGSKAERGTKNPQLNYSGDLRSFVDSHPSIEFNLHLGDVIEANKSGSLREAIMIFRKVAGNQFINKAQLRSLINEKVKTLDFLR